AKNDEALLKRLQNPKTPLIGYDIKRCVHLSKRFALPVSFTDDVMIMANLVHSSLTSAEKISEAYGLSTTETYEEIYGTPNRPKLPEEEKILRFACEKANHIFTLYEQFQSELTGDLLKVYQEMELPLSPVLFEMEEEGIRCEALILKTIADEMKGSIDAVQETVFQEAGHEFNLNSPKQLAEVLFDELHLPTGKKRSTGADVLEKLKDSHPIIESLLTYRKLQKIYSTYAEGLQKYIRDDGRIHTLFNQCATQTGRLSSSEPNLQNISVRDEQGRIIRKAFLPEEGHVLMSSDYHQIELRILASMADEESMIDAFNHDIDIHTKTAMDVFGVEEADVTSEMRRRAKTVNFGIVYGISDFGLAEQLGISRREAADFIATYYQKYPKIRTFMDSIVTFCEKNGYVLTLCGRKREIPEIREKNRMVREFGKRAAMNAPIQGTAADLIKIAMIRIDEMMKKAGVKSRILLQVHDELIFDVPKEEIETMRRLVTEGMVTAMMLKVPLTVECSIGNDWYEAK
ncbi:MAG: DNA polymerase I, partial [Solobacterium sp.]|nr:DNA polymerase I [Solobacterium sp.]